MVTKKKVTTNTKAAVKAKVSKELAPSVAPKTDLELQQEARIAELEQQNQTLQKPLDEEEDGTLVFGIRVPEGAVLSDPFSTQNPHQIQEHPPGLVLQWCNPNLRDRMGWKGWEPVTYTSEIGKNLPKYINDAPARMKGVAGIDNYVRRGTDSILCSLPASVYAHRLFMDDHKAKAATDSLSGTEDQILRNGDVVISGDGVTEDKRPQGGWRMRHSGNATRGDFISDSTEYLESKDRDTEVAKKALHN